MFITSNITNPRKVQKHNSFIAIFLLFSIFMTGSTASGLTAYGLSNQTDSQEPAVIQSMTVSSQQEITENTDHQSESETGSSNKSSDNVNGDQSIAGESNTITGSTKHNLTVIVSLIHRCQNALLMRMVTVLMGII